MAGKDVKSAPKTPFSKRGNGNVKTDNSRRDSPSGGKGKPSSGSTRRPTGRKK